MILSRRGISWFLILVMSNASLAPPGTVHAGWPSKPATSVERLAGSIDRIEKQIDQYGSIVAKSPDVWGEARLTKYRMEYEDQLSKKLGSFDATINATISRSDQTFVANALALQAAVSGSRATVLAPAAAQGTAGTQPGRQTSEPPIPAADSKDMVPEAKFEDLLKAKSEQKLESAQDKIALEPTIMLDQLSRYLQHLHQLRRISDGDDKADSPGYALHLVRIPVSVLPGDRTRQGYGAELTVIAKPHLHERLLPDTFRGLVINDLVDQWSFPLAKFIDQPKAKEILASFYRGQPTDEQKKQAKDAIKVAKETVERNKNSYIEANNAYRIALLKSSICALQNLLSELSRVKVTSPEIEQRIACAIDTLQAKIHNVNIAIVVNNALPLHGNTSPPIDGNPQQENETFTINQLEAMFKRQEYNLSRQQIKSFLDSIPDSRSPRGIDNQSYAAEDILEAAQREASCDAACEEVVTAIGQVEQALNTVGESVINLSSTFIIPSLSTTPSRRAQQPFPLSLTFDVHDGTGLADVAQKMLNIKLDARNEPQTLLLDIQKVLAEEFQAAYDFLNHQPDLWTHCSPELAAAVRRKDSGMLKLLNGQFRNSIPVDLAQGQRYTIALAWAIIVESALLNERLVDDMASLAAARNAYCLRTDWLPYYGPSPPPEAVQAFNDYVNCRWPIHVVALDPVTQEQNVADSFSQRRELQLALSLAFTSGRLSAQNFTRLARRLDLDLETIALHRTAVGFSHGDDTFGWRFYPRIQGPAPKGNLTTFAETLFTGGPGRDAMLRNSRLEPGIRECTAIVIMPSFVPYVIFDTRANWFRLPNPARKELDLREGVGLSAEITGLRQLTRECTRDAHMYRQDEVYRLTRAVEQLERRLPMQTTYVQMPFENSLGGFEFFNSGTADLAPELNGFYGEPGLSQDRDTTLFVVGNHFSVHETRVIVGGQKLEDKRLRLLSRQVMEITVPADLLSFKQNNRDIVDMHVATPYGLSNHLDIPLLPKKADPVQQIVKAIADHVEQKHVDQFLWETDAGTARIVTAGQCQVVQVAVSTNGVILNRHRSPYDRELADQTPVFRAWVYTLSKQPGAKPVKLKGYITGVLDRGDSLSRLRLNPVVLNSELKAVFELPENELPADTAEIILEGFLSLQSQQRSEIVRLENLLRLKASICNQQVCLTPCGDSVPQTTAPSTPSTVPALPQAPSGEQTPVVEQDGKATIFLPPVLPTR